MASASPRGCHTRVCLPFCTSPKITGTGSTFSRYVCYLARFRRQIDLWLLVDLLIGSILFRGICNVFHLSSNGGLGARVGGSRSDMMSEERPALRRQCIESSRVQLGDRLRIVLEEKFSTSAFDDLRREKNGRAAETQSTRYYATPVFLSLTDTNTK